MRSYEASTRIQASPDAVWQRLVAVDSWRDWDSGVDRVEGRVALGERLTVYATMIRTRPFTVTVTEIRPARGHALAGRAAGRDWRSSSAHTTSRARTTARRC